MSKEQSRRRHQLAGQQLVSAMELRTNSICRQRQETVEQSAEREFKSKEAMSRTLPGQCALTALPAKTILSLPDTMPMGMRCSITASVPKRASVEEALQLLSIVMTDLMKKFVQTCKSMTDPTHHTLQQSSNHVLESLNRLDRTALHLLTDTDLDQAVQSLSQDIQATWEALHKQMSTFVSELVANLHGSAYLSIDAIQTDISSHLMRFNATALANKRAVDGVVSGFKMLNLKLEKRISQELQAALTDWKCLVTKHRIRTFADEICQPGFMRHVDFMPTVSCLRQNQQEFAAKVLAGMTKSLLLPSAIHAPAQSQQAYQSIQGICVAWKDEIESGVKGLWEQHAYQIQCTHSLGESVQKWCTTYTGYTSEEVSKLFENECGILLESARERETCLIKCICKEMDTQHRKWAGMVQNFWLCLIRRCATMFDEHAKMVESAFAKSQSVLFEHQAKHQQAVHVQDLWYQHQLQKISTALSEDALAELHVEAVQHLNNMLQEYHISHDALLKVLDEQGTLLMSMQDKHEANVFDVLGILPTGVNTSPDEEECEQGEREAQGTQPTIQAGHGDLVSEEQTCSVVDVCPPNAQLPLYNVYNLQYTCRQDLVSMLLAMPFELIPGAVLASSIGEVVQAVAAGDAATQSYTSLEPDDRMDTRKTNDVGGLVHVEDLDILREFNIAIPEAALRTSVDVLVHHLMEDVIKHRHQATHSIEVWKTQSAAYLTARLDRLLQHHRPRMGILDEDWCENRRLELRGLDSQLTQFLQSQASEMASRVHDFDKQVELGVVSSERILADLKAIAHEFGTCCSVKAVENCEWKMNAKFEAAKHGIGSIFRNIEDNTTRALDQVITSMQEFLRDTPPASSTSPTEQKKASCAPQCLQALKLSVNEAKQKLCSVVKSGCAALIADAGTIYGEMQSCLSKFKSDAEFVESTEKTKDDMNRPETSAACIKQQFGIIAAVCCHCDPGKHGYKGVQTMAISSCREFGNVLQTSRNCTIEIQRLLGELLSCTTKAKGASSGAQAADSNDALLTVANRLRQCLLSRGTQLEVLNSSTAAFETSTALPLIVHSDSYKAHYNNSEVMAAAEKSTAETHHQLPVHSRAKVVLDVALTSLGTAASLYYTNVDDTTASHRPDIPTDQQIFMAQQEHMLEELSHQCDQHVKTERRIFREQVLSAYNALHAIPNALCNAHVVFGVEGIRKKLEQETVLYKDRVLKLELSRQGHQQELSSPLMLDSAAQLESLIQKEQERQTCIHKLNSETASAMRAFLETNTHQILQTVAQMCISVSDMLSCWVLPADLVADEYVDTDSCAMASPFQYLTLLQSIMEGSNVDLLDDDLGRNVGRMKWKPSDPSTSTSTDYTTSLDPVAMESEVQGVTVVSSNTAPHWLLIHAQKQASEKLLQHGQLELAPAMAFLSQVHMKEDMWRSQWESMIADVRTGNKYV